ncbi:MAG: DUF4976 domain-containing protein [Lentisphaerae bacterium]|nr:MAG: DUF4976 domain-containing protein [Lentisphaerota bacterium]
MSHYDIFPTFLDIAGMSYSEAEPLPGRSFADRLRGETPPSSHDHRDIVIFDEYGPVRMIRDRHWKYIHRYPYGPHELYDLENDPEEVFNLADHADYAHIVQDMRKRLEGWFMTYSQPEIDGRSQGVTGKGQIDWADHRARGGRRYFPR